MRLLCKIVPKYVVSRYMSMEANNRNLVAVCQMTSSNNKENNFKTCERLIMLAASKRAKMVFLPEACDYIGENKHETVQLAEPLNGPLVQKFCDLAKSNGIWLSLGGIHEKISAEKVSNAHVIIDSNGKVNAVYRKIHLFDVDLPEKGILLNESDIVMKGKEIIPPVDTPIGKVGLGICYDMRFAELGLMMTNLGAEVLTYPSAFTYVTGAAHWEVLLRARAIENQCYVVAAAQTGCHNKKRSSWGHAMIVDPWGCVIAQCPEGTHAAIVDMDLSYTDSVRSSMPVWKHRRNDIYPKMVSNLDCNTSEQDVYQFGQSFVKADKVFLRTSKTIAFTNRKCVIPGHVLVAPMRCVKRLADLAADEIADMFLMVQRVQKVVEDIHCASSSTITVQDGPQAGQTIQHVHVHILPRKAGDFARNDEIYASLEANDKFDYARNEEDMIEEARILQKHFN